MLKIVQSPQSTAGRPGYWPGVFLEGYGPGPPPMYWKREALAYRSGLLERLPDGLAAPRCFAADERSPSVYWLWLEDVADAYDGRWSLARYQETAHHLGRFNAAYPAGHPLPTDPWLRHPWMRSWLYHLARHGEMEWIWRAGREDPAIRRAFPRSAMERMVRLWQEREVFLAALDRMPQTLCHRDVYPANILARRRPDGQAETVAVDWAFVGIGPLGEDLPALVTINPPSAMVPVDIARLEERAFESYLQGLSEVGWDGDVRMVRLGYAASAALRYACLTPGVIVLSALDPDARATMEQRSGQSIDAIMQREAARLTHFLDLADEARRLMRHV